MKNYLLLICILFSLALVRADYNYASCVFLAGNPVVGSIQFAETDAGLTVFVNVTGSNFVSGNNHTIQIFTYGDVENFGPILPTPNPPALVANSDCVAQTGDLGNWTVTGNTIQASKLFDSFMHPSLGNSQVNIVGRGVQIFEKGADCNGQLGNVIGQCVIGLSDPQYVSPDSPVAKLIGGGANLAQSNSETDYAVCEFESSYPSTGAVAGITGRVVFQGPGPLIKVTGSFNIPAATKSAHGLHIHMFGDLSSPDYANNGKPNGSTVGGHWKIGSQVHALPSDSNNGTRDYGDLGNLCENENNLFTYAYNFDSFNLTSAWGYQNLIGRAMALHAAADLGNSNVGGSRIALCVIGIMDATGTIPTVKSGNTSPGTCTVSTTTTGDSTTSTTGDSTTSTTGTTGTPGTTTGNQETTTGTTTGNNAAFNTPSIFVALILAIITMLF